MTDAQRRRMEKFDREKVFMSDNNAEFPVDSPGDKVSNLINTKIDEALALDADLTQELGERRAAQEAKDDSRDLLVDLLRDFATGAVAVGNEVPGITAQFKVPENRSDQNLIAAATAFFEASQPHLAKFAEVGISSADRDNLLTFRDNFANARAQWESAVEEHAGAVGALDALFRDLMALSRKLSAIIKLKFRDNSGKLAAWTVASHLDRPPKLKNDSPAPVG